jgi:hypothetical protein
MGGGGSLRYPVSQWVLTLEIMVLVPVRTNRSAYPREERATGESVAYVQTFVHRRTYDTSIVSPMLVGWLLVCLLHDDVIQVPMYVPYVRIIWYVVVRTIIRYHTYRTILVGYVLIIASVSESIKSVSRLLVGYLSKN